MTAPTAAPLRHTLTRLHGGLIVSCQAPPEDPISGPETMSRVASSVVAGGAVGIRAEGLDDLVAIRARVDVPIIGLIKDGREGVYITPTVAHAEAVAALGVEFVAVDATQRPRPDGRPLGDTVAAVHRHGAGLMADVADLDQARAAVRAGADVVGTTLAGYLGCPIPREPDLELVAALAAELTVPVIAEGRYSTAEQVRAALAAGAWAVVMGTAITRPQIITRTLLDGVRAVESPPEQEPQ